MDIHLSPVSILIVVVVSVVLLIVVFFLGRIYRFRDMQRERKDAIKRSESVILGSVYEKILPFLPDFPYSPKDMIFLGKGFDYLVLDGLTDGHVRKIVFLEVKSGGSRLNSNEKIIRDAVENRRVEWKEWRF